MGKDAGMLRYIINAPLARPWNYVKHGGGWAAFVSAFEASRDSSQPFVDAFIAYLLAKFYLRSHRSILPPRSFWELSQRVCCGVLIRVSNPRTRFSGRSARSTKSERPTSVSRFRARQLRYPAIFSEQCCREPESNPPFRPP